MNIDITGAEHSPIPADEMRSLIVSILEQEQVEHDASLSIAFVQTDVMERLNREHMGKAGPTDVLSFPIEDAAPGVPPRRLADGPPIELGDIVVCSDVVRANAESHGVSFVAEMRLILAHGALHILGWDHMEVDEAEAMEAREAQYLSAAAP